MHLRAAGWLALVLLGACESRGLETTTYQYDARYPVAQLDVIVPENVTTDAAVFYAHGGGWESGTRGNDTGTVERLARLGYIVVNIDYRLVPDGAFPAAVQDVFCALAFVQERGGELGIDPQRIVAMGHSAGAHLTALLGVAGSTTFAQDAACPSGAAAPPAAVIPVAGPMDLSKMQSDIVAKFVGSTFDADPARWADASPLTHVRPELPPFLLVHAEHDLVVPVEQSEAMQDSLRAAGVSASLLRLEGGGHVLGDGAGLGYEQFELSTDTPEAWMAIADFLERTVGAP